MNVTQRLLLSTAIAAALTIAAAPAAAQTQATPVIAGEQLTPEPAAAPAPTLPSAATDNAMTNLVRILAERGVITREAGAALIAQAHAEAQQARTAQAQAQSGGDGLPPPPPGAIRVPYVPASVRQQIRDELRAEVLAQARREGWAAPSQAAAEWTRAITIYGDVRVRSQSTMFADTNSNTIFDFARINQIGPVDVLNTVAIPYLNTRVDRPNELRLRARLAIDAKVSDELTAGVMIATGDDPSPISPNVILGGGFAKRSIWLQRGYIRYQPTDWATLTAGRFDNPFLSTEIVFDQDLSFDGFAGQVAFGGIESDGVMVAARGGVFPLDFGDPNYPSTVQDKVRFAQKYLFSGQLEAGFALGGGADLRVAAAYHHFENLRGELSSPCLTYAGALECSTDGTRPFFQRQGNTLSPLRQIVVDPNLPPNTIQPQPQFFGLTFNYHLLDVSAVASIPVGETRAVFGGNYVRNLGYKARDLCRNGLLGQPFNNGGPDGDGNICSATSPTSFIGGPEGWTAYATIGQPVPRRWGQWNAFVAYRYIESDAALDSFVDDNFHNGGTNAKGYIVGASLGLSRNLWIAGRWLSANEVAGDPFAVDMLQIDLNAAF